MTVIDKLLQTARAEIGYIEKASNQQLDNPTANPGNKNWNKYARDLDSIGNVYNGKKNGYDWCDVFIDWCFIKTFGVEIGMKLLCQEYSGAGAGCTYSANYYRQKGQFYSTPKAGDQIFFTKNGGKTCYHTGLVEKVANGKVYTIEGNTSSASGVVENGGCVRAKNYPLGASYIAGYGRPDWNLVGNEEEEEMTLEQFKILMNQYRDELRDNDASSYSEQARQWAKDTNLVAGGSTDEFNGMWEDLLTREQLFTVLYRFAQNMGKA